ncbi:MAG: hypothetical protein Q9157_002249 [Trypethelium eluteriae]
MLPRSTSNEFTRVTRAASRFAGAAAPVYGKIVAVAFLSPVAVAFGEPMVKFPGAKTDTATATLDGVNANVAVEPLYSRLGETESRGAAEVTTEAAVRAAALAGRVIEEEMVVEALMGIVLDPPGAGTTDSALSVDVELSTTTEDDGEVTGGPGLEMVLNTTGIGPPTKEIELDVDEGVDAADVVPDTEVLELILEGDVGVVRASEEFPGPTAVVTSLSRGTTAVDKVESTAVVVAVKTIAVPELVAPCCGT